MRIFIGHIGLTDYMQGVAILNFLYFKDKKCHGQSKI